MINILIYGGTDNRWKLINSISEYQFPYTLYVQGESIDSIDTNSVNVWIDSNLYHCYKVLDLQVPTLFIYSEDDLLELLPIYDTDKILIPRGCNTIGQSGLTFPPFVMERYINMLDACKILNPNEELLINYASYICSSEETDNVTISCLYRNIERTETDILNYDKMTDYIKRHPKENKYK
jgi:hypothetical protein